MSAYISGTMDGYVTGHATSVDDFIDKLEDNDWEDIDTDWNSLVRVSILGWWRMPLCLPPGSLTFSGKAHTKPHACIDWHDHRSVRCIHHLLSNLPTRNLDSTAQAQEILLRVQCDDHRI